MKPSDTRARVDNIIFNETLRRFTQDSPVLADVWQDYMTLALGRQGHERVDLLLEPHRRSSPEALCEALRKRLSSAAEKKRRQQLPQQPQKSVGLSFNDSHVVVRLSLGELIRTALPLTKWWDQYVWEPTAASGKRLDAVGVAASDQAVERLDPGTQEAGYARLLWLLRVVGTIALCGEGGPAGDAPTGAELVEALWRSVRGMDAGDRGDQHDLWSVSRNRTVQLSTWKSVVSTKADAATRLFDLSCSKLTWAVIDSGIDATHPAFRRRRGEQAVELDEGAIGRCTRVKKTYDFNLLRELTQVDGRLLMSSPSVGRTLSFPSH
jgi:serine protease AprX